MPTVSRKHWIQWIRFDPPRWREYCGRPLSHFPPVLNKELIPGNLSWITKGHASSWRIWQNRNNFYHPQGGRKLRLQLYIHAIPGDYQEFFCFTLDANEEVYGRTKTMIAGCNRVMILHVFFVPN